MVCCLSNFPFENATQIFVFDVRVLFFSLVTIIFSTALSFVGTIFDILVLYSTCESPSFKTFILIFKVWDP